MTRLEGGRREGKRVTVLGGGGKGRERDVHLVKISVVTRENLGPISFRRVSTALTRSFGAAAVAARGIVLAVVVVVVMGSVFCRFWVVSLWS